MRYKGDERKALAIKEGDSTEMMNTRQFIV